MYQGIADRITQDVGIRIKVKRLDKESLKKVIEICMVVFQGGKLQIEPELLSKIYQDKALTYLDGKIPQEEELPNIINKLSELAVTSNISNTDLEIDIETLTKV